MKAPTVSCSARAAGAFLVGEKGVVSRVFAREVLQPEKGGFYVGARTDCGGYYEVILEIVVYLALARGHPDVGVVARHGNGELRQVLDAFPSGCLGRCLFRLLAVNSGGGDSPSSPR